MRAITCVLPLLAVLAGCNADPTGAGSSGKEAEVSSSANPEQTDEDALAARDPAPGEQAQVDIPDPEKRPTMQMQVVLDRLGFTPGVVDGRMGMSTRNAIEGFQEANDIEVTGEADEETKKALEKWNNIPATRVVTIPASFASEPFRNIPDSAADKAEMERLGYTSLDEKLAERFHTTVDVLKRLNPGGRPAGMEQAGASPSEPARLGLASPSASPSATPSADAGGDAERAQTSMFAAGQQIRVPNVGNDRIEDGAVENAQWRSTLATLGIGTNQPEAARVVVSKSGGTLKVYDDADKLVAMYTATMGSEHDPLPLGEWKVVGVAHNPPFQYDPDLFWDVPDSEEDRMLPPGPNGPVGVVWIDLSKEHYGIHGTPEPQTIGRAQSHGCVRLTNWDAARLAEMVSPGTQVLFEA
ncbi:peptidoglycan-binding protein [Novosphingobium marinum]|uniref:Lipoprotein-anchoring transpeptidase ErfK/SrfK n=1 Tax=Novosphingobium marinum TaxID=1514948 RepID=A0A7Y9XVN8_9SPHN|nr:L,D-transpeptidase family protein [Novosphingobium marinum]NYH95471.1 lipoprotein-anchoring transpeptidase ErfK/SrfK [Novosphingobium marinum]GGC27354.1 peptidoglycan-binding protein [Novosphingobium marinum]